MGNDQSRLPMPQCVSKQPCTVYTVDRDRISIRLTKSFQCETGIVWNAPLKMVSVEPILTRTLESYHRNQVNIHGMVDLKHSPYATACGILIVYTVTDVADKKMYTVFSPDEESSVLAALGGDNVSGRSRTTPTVPPPITGPSPLARVTESPRVRGNWHRDARDTLAIQSDRRNKYHQRTDEDY